jgi:hypothetical protein
MNRKSLKDISWNVSEKTYRADSALSYSTLARYEREGFNNLDKLFDKIETPSLTFGSAVDSIITGGQEEFDERFMVAEFPSITDSITKIVKSLFSQYGDSYRSLITIPDDTIIKETECQSYQMNWKPETRARVIKEKGADYYNLLFIAGSRTILNTQTYQDVCNAVRALKESESTKFYFADNNPFEPNIERLYQLKFKAYLGGIEYRCMFDELVIFHDTKEIQPLDLKTSCKRLDREWDFPSHYIEWSYEIQNRLYARILQDVISKDEYFKDFKILPYKDIIIFRGSDTPLVWDIPFTFERGTLYFGKNKQIEMRDPEEIGKELSYYLTSRPKVPMGISNTGVNDLREWLNTL